MGEKGTFANAAQKMKENPKINIIFVWHGTEI